MLRTASLFLRDRFPDERDGPYHRQEANDVPGRIELVSLRAEVRRPLVGMVVVMQRLAADEPREERVVEGGVREVLETPPMAEAVDGGRQHEDVHHEMQECGQDSGPGSEHPDEHTGAEKESDVPADPVLEDVAIRPVPGNAGSEHTNGLGVACLTQVEKEVPELDLQESALEGAMRIVGSVRMGVMRHVHGAPFTA